MASSRKKVIVRTMQGDALAGYLPTAGFVEGNEQTLAVELFNLEGRNVAIPFKNIQWIAYVRDFNLGDAVDPERLTRRTFLARPRSEGLWLRLTLRQGETLEGLVPTDLALIDGLVEDHGLFLVPPDIRSNTQRLFVPRSAFIEVRLLAVITTPSKSRAAPAAARPRPQHDLLFPDDAGR